jgi:hypothetical protein
MGGGGGGGLEGSGGPGAGLGNVLTNDEIEFGDVDAV